MLVEFMLLTVDIFDELNMTGAENIVEITRPNATLNRNTSYKYKSQLKFSYSEKKLWRHSMH